MRPVSNRLLLVRTAAFVQGLALVVVPTASTTLTSAHGLGLTEANYGTLFVPQSLLAVAFSLGGAAIEARLGTRTTLLIGFAANTIAMAAIASAAFFAPGGSAFAVLLVGTGFLGIGFSIVTPTLNVLAAKLEPRTADRAGLIVNALLGGSAAIAPLLSIAFVSAGRWWGLPLLCAIGMLGLMVAALRTSFEDGGSARTRKASTKLPQRVWLFAAFALAYGICEQIDASWAPLYLTHQLGAAAALGSIALTFFWAISTAGRAFFATASAKAKPTVVFRVLPFVLALSFAVLALLPVHAPGAYGVAAFAVAGLGISALLPLVLSLSERAMPGVATEATSIVFASYLIGYGIAAFGVGPLQERGISLPTIDVFGLGIALVVAVLAFVIVKSFGEAA